MMAGESSPYPKRARERGCNLFFPATACWFEGAVARRPGHTAVNQVYRAPKDILLTQRFARHSSVLVTSIYLHPTDEDLARSVRRIPC